MEGKKAKKEQKTSEDGRREDLFVGVHVPIPRDFYNKFSERCREYGVNKTQVIRLLVKDWSEGNIVNRHNLEIGPSSRK